MPENRKKCTCRRKRIKRIGVYGGKYDCIHYGHLTCAEWTAEAFDLDRVLFVVSANPPHKSTGVLDAEHRYEMVVAAVSDNPRFEASRIEIERALKFPEKPSFTVDTLKDVRKKYGRGVEINLMLSSEYLDPDHAWYLPKWHGAAEIFKLARLLIFPRGDGGLVQAQAWAKLMPAEARISFLEVPSPPISSTLLRDRVAAGKSLFYLTPWAVQALIKKHGHYLPKSGGKSGSEPAA